MTGHAFYGDDMEETVTIFGEVVNLRDDTHEPFDNVAEMKQDILDYTSKAREEPEFVKN